MIEGVIIKELTKYEDARGWLTEFFRSDELPVKPEMAYISATKPGVARGPHEHVYQTDVFAFVGPGTMLLKLWDKREGSKTKGEEMSLELGENKPAVVVVPAGVVHAYKCISETDAWSINLPDKLYRGEGKKEEVDEVRWENVPNSPYKI